MSLRIMMAVACSLAAAPAFANCSEELRKLEPAVVSAETGASPTNSGTAATPHQKEVMSEGQSKVDSEATGATGQVEALSPHQQQVMGKGAEGEADHASQLMKDAQQMAKAGDENGCMQKLAELKQLLGAK